MQTETAYTEAVFTARSVAQRGIAMISCLSVCPSVCNVGGLLSYALEFV